MKKIRTSHRHRGLSFAALILGASLATSAMAQDNRLGFNIPAENTAQALNDFTLQAGVQLMFPYDAAVKFQAPAIQGHFTRDEALAKLIANTNLEIASESADLITLRVAKDKSASSVDPAAPNEAAQPITEVIVTGTHIRGGNPTSPVHTLTRKDIDASGYSQIGDLMRSLPENFSGGQNPGVIGADSANAQNYSSSGGSSMNLRGLGSDATLVLLNGHRLSGDMYFQGADISSVPLGAVQRVEVVTDGASAIYGADAVAGVVNLVLRKNYDGAEISVRGGAATQGGLTERTVSALTGKSGYNGHILVDIEYSKSDGLTTADRDFTSAATTVSSLIPPTTRHSLFMSGGWSFGDQTSIGVDALVADRAINGVSQQDPTAIQFLTAAYTPSYSISATVDIALPGDWKLNGIASASGSRNSFHTIFPDYAIDSLAAFANWNRYVELNADGTLLTLPTGDVKLAAGAGYRTEGYRNDARIDKDRHVSYVFAEALIPLVSPSATRPGLHELEVSLAGRTENYSDFGSSTNPKVGIRYAPTDTLTIRGTWSSAFKAPSFVQMYDRSTLYLWNATSVGGTGTGTVLMTYGGNPNLKAETSSSKTLGAEFEPTQTLSLSATYFAIDYKGRIVQPVNNYFTGLINPIYAPFVERDPSPARQAELQAAAAAFTNYSSGPYDPATVVAVIQDQYLNATAQSIDGLDLSYRQSWTLSDGNLSAFGNATWTRLKQQTSAVAPNVTLSGTLFNVPKFKARGGLTWQTGALSATAIANFISSEADTIATPNVRIASWATVDATISYHFQATDGLNNGVTATLSTANLFDRMPPHALGPSLAFPGLAFDSTNTSVVGRFVSLTLKKAW